jgi:hypothetical protein
MGEVRGGGTDLWWSWSAMVVVVEGWLLTIVEDDL